MDHFSIIIAFFSLVVAGVSLGWNVYRDCVERGKLKVTAYVADVFIPGSGPKPEVISVRVTNTGKKPIVIDGHSFLLKNKTNLMPMDSYATFHNRRLEPGEYISTTLSNALVLNRDSSIWARFRASFHAFLISTRPKAVLLAKTRGFARLRIL